MSYSDRDTHGRLPMILARIQRFMWISQSLHWQLKHINTHLATFCKLASHTISIISVTSSLHFLHMHALKHTRILFQLRGRLVFTLQTFSCTSTFRQSVTLLFARTVCMISSTSNGTHAVA